MKDAATDQKPQMLPAAYDSKVEGNVIFTRLDAAMNWMRKNSLWPMPMGLACCAIEIDGDSLRPVRYRALWRRGDAFLRRVSATS